MKAIQVTCPNCGAQLRVNEASATASCEYCGTVSAIQRRTRIFERVMPPQISPEQLRQQALRYAVQKHSRGWIIGVLVASMLPFLIIGIVVWTVVGRATRINIPSKFEINLQPGAAFGSNVNIKIQKPSERGPSWQGTDSVLVVDVDGDGVPELVGRGRQVNAGDLIRVVAIDLLTGTFKWQSEPIGTYTDTYTGPLALAGDLIVFASNKGEIQTLALRDGKARWRVQLEERTLAFCAPDDKTLIAVGADDTLRMLSRADGSSAGPAKPAPGKGKPFWDKVPPCNLLVDDSKPTFERLQAAKRRSPATHSNRHGKKHGISVDVAMDIPGGGTLLSGAKSEGTRVTTLVATDDTGAERWRTTGAPDALGATGAPRQVAVGEREACIVYYGSTYRIACFAVADGKRLWDLDAPAHVDGLLIVARTLVVTTASALDVYDVDNGNKRWSSKSW